MTTNATPRETPARRRRNARNELIRLAHDNGWSVRKIALATGCGLATVHAVLTNAEETP